MLNNHFINPTYTTRGSQIRKGLIKRGKAIENEGKAGEGGNSKLNSEPHQNKCQPRYDKEIYGS